MPTLLPELNADGLVLWRVRNAPNAQLWCSVDEYGGELILTVHNVATDAMPVAETHPNVGSLIARAEVLRRGLVAAGWHEVDVDLDEPD